MTFELLVSCVKKDPHELAKTMNIASDAVIVSQQEENSSEEVFTFGGHRVHMLRSCTKGVGLNRNTCIEMSEADIILFSDEDIVYDEGYEAKVLKDFTDHPEADVILFNMRVCDERRTYRNKDYKKVGFYNCGRYPAYSIAARAAKIKSSRIKFSLLFGGGAKYSNGEDSLFLRDCLKAGLNLLASPVELGEEVPRPSTWFFGYNDKIFYDRGVLYHFLYGGSAWLWGLRWVTKMRYDYVKDYSYKRALKMIFMGIKDGNLTDRVFEEGQYKGIKEKKYAINKQSK